jgi:hypothetical protein
VPVGRKRVVELALPFEGVAEVAMSGGVVRPQGDGLPVGGGRLVEPALLLQQGPRLLNPSG